MRVSRCDSTGFRFGLTLALLAITWLALTPSGAQTTEFIYDKAAHVLAFLVLAILADAAFAGKAFWRYKGLPLLIYGSALEIMQTQLSYRSGSWLDLLTDFSAILVYFLLTQTGLLRFEKA